ncbi:murein transglycosylase A [Neorhizobium sp. JUb45]|uniref:murein transglycosylase A n=1 Tax=unclassified Neorhizobium TaxID=2629175 RepID=UPI00104D084B|nr:murein transglycosylase A [Neorhizobium sp. JUb45]TCQ99643.1 membrane-bound lytic murein transglycosylase A [Neorhizobium sp. JUb45]
MNTIEYALTPTTYKDIVGWNEDDPSALFSVMRDCLDYLEKAKPYRTGSLGLSTDDLLPLLKAAAGFQISGPDATRLFFEEHCLPFMIRRSDEKSGFVTGFFEPEIDVSDQPDETYRYPFYRRPADLIDIDDGNRTLSLDPSYAFARLRDGVIDPYPDRGEIDRGYLQGQGLEIAWAKSKIDVFFTHVQGAARLRYPDGCIGRITYAAKAGHPFSAIGRLLIDRGEIDPTTVSMQTIRDWLSENPAKVDEVLWHNRSYIFFREAAVAGLDQGPIAAAKVPLVAGRSLAVDRLIHTFGFPFFIRSTSLTHLDGGKPFARTMLALDTGSAIVGPARGDIFTGSGYDAGEQAGIIKHPADFYILLPKAAAARFAP